MRVHGARTSPLPGMPPGVLAHCCCCCSLCCTVGLPGRFVMLGMTLGYTAVMFMAGLASPTLGRRCCWGCCCGACCCWLGALLVTGCCCCCCCLRWLSAGMFRCAGAAAPLGDSMPAVCGGVVRSVRGAGSGVQSRSCKHHSTTHTYTSVRNT